MPKMKGMSIVVSPEKAAPVQGRTKQKQKYGKNEKEEEKKREKKGKEKKIKKTRPTPVSRVRNLQNDLE